MRKRKSEGKVNGEASLPELRSRRELTLVGIQIARIPATQPG
jgi:hypothetical protein